MPSHARRGVFLLLACAAAGASLAALLPPPVRAEIDALMARLETSSCEFNRNGSWYTAAEAKTHLLGKLKYLEDRGAVNSTEQFIERAATRSSMSGEPYLVRCASAAPVPSGKWLHSQLQLMRSSPGAKGAPQAVRHGPGGGVNGILEAGELHE